MLGLRTVIYKVDDLDRAKAWYREVFETEPYFDEVHIIDFADGDALINALLADQIDIAADVSSASVDTIKGTTVTLIVRISPNPTTSVDSRKKAFAKMGGTVADEPTLGAGAYSATRPGTSRIYAVKGEQMFRIDYVTRQKEKHRMGCWIGFGPRSKRRSPAFKEQAGSKAPIAVIFGQCAAIRRSYTIDFAPSL